MSYVDFLATKARVAPSCGIEVPASVLHPEAFAFQRDIARWSLRKGRAAIFSTTGTGKTVMELMWSQHAGRRVLNLAPLGVARQTVREGEKWGIPVTYARSMAESPSEGITITNYEMVEHFNPDAYDAVALDESSCLKSFESKTRTKLIEMFADTPMRLCGTATPAPNDITEMANHAEFLGVMKRTDMLATFFVHDDQGWRLKKPARRAFFRWLASWAMSLNRPSDIGYSDDGYILPPLTVAPHVIPVDFAPAGKLFAVGLAGITERSTVRKASVTERVSLAAELINGGGRWIAWCGRNDEGYLLERLVPDGVLVEGAQAPDVKADRLAAFADGATRVLISKPTVAGFGLNFQGCHRMVFVGLSDSWEQYFQAIRRCWRFGQTEPVEVHIVLTEPEQVIYDNVLRKEREAQRMSEELVQHVAQFERAEISDGHAHMDYRPQTPMALPSWL